MILVFVWFGGDVCHVDNIKKLKTKPSCLIFSL